MSKFSSMRESTSKRQLSISHGKDVSCISAHQPYSPDIYQRPASSCSVRSSEMSRSTIRSSNSFKVAAQRVAGAFTTCFVPQKIKSEAQKDISQENTSSNYHVSTDSGTGQESTVLTISDICKATTNFSENNIVRRGGSSSIYKGKLKGGSLIAVKCAKKLNGQYLSAELRQEFSALPKVEHLNLVRFLGFFDHKDENMIVVEFVSNGSLREHLDGSRGNGLELPQRLNIAIDVAHAITYLHEYTDQPIIHRDIRSSNVLLTDALTAKVTGFGFARMVDEDSEATHISTQIKGTAGYVDPEYLSTYQLTDKSDVYSFGVLLVELVTGRMPIERRRDLQARATTKWAMYRYKVGEAVVAMDPRMRRSPASVSAVEKMMQLAEQCIAPSRKERPSMRKCTEVLWTVRRDYHSRQEPSQQAASPAVTEDGNSERIVREDRSMARTIYSM